jgi:hypothetical protein
MRGQTLLPVETIITAFALKDVPKWTNYDPQKDNLSLTAHLLPFDYIKTVYLHSKCITEVYGNRKRDAKTLRYGVVHSIRR